MYKLRFILLLFLLGFVSCNSDDEKKLLSNVNQELVVSKKDSVGRTSGSVEQYKWIEFQMNREYVKALKEQPIESFEKQLEIFEDNELGVIKSYVNMFRFLLKSKETWDDDMIVKSNRYFNSLEIESDIVLLNQKHLTDIKDIRERFMNANKQLPDVKKIDLPEQQVSLAAFSNHTRNNMFIEIGSDIIQPILGWLLSFIIVQVFLFFADKVIGSYGCVVDIVVFAIIAISSVFLSSGNDSDLLENLRKQNQQEFKIDDKAILNKLNQNTIQFYESYQK